MDYVKIGGKVWKVIVLDVSESFSILYSENTGRTMSLGAGMTLDPLGTFFNHTVTFARKPNEVDEFDKLYDFLSIPRYDGIDVDIVHNQETLKYKAYVSQGERKLTKIDLTTDTVYWDTFTAEFIAMEAQVLPE